MKISKQSGNKVLLVMTVLLTFFWANVSFAQDTEPRRWAQTPTGVNFAGIGYSYTDGDIIFDPLLQIEDAVFYLH